MRVPNLRGAGNWPRLTMRQTVADEQDTMASTTGCLTFAESGNVSKCWIASRCLFAVAVVWLVNVIFTSPISVALSGDRKILSDAKER